MKGKPSELRWLVAYSLLVGVSVGAAVFATRLGYSAPSDLHTGTFWLTLASAIWVLGATLVWLYNQWRAGVESPLRSVSWASLKSGALALTARMLPPAGIAIFGGWFGVLKQLVPSMGGFRLDGTLAQLDYILFLGHDPWRLAHALFGPFAGFIDDTYGVWLLVLLAFPYAVALLAPAGVRARFFLTWILSWVVLGIALAIALASAGPMFLQNMHLAGAEHYQGLLPALKDAPIAQRIHDYLWELYQHGETKLGGGISAAPSMHVAMAWLYVVTTWRWWKPLAIPAIGFFAVIAVGSVFLGYHYAVDGMMSVAGVSLIWTLVGRWVEGHPLLLARWGFPIRPRQGAPAVAE